MSNTVTPVSECDYLEEDAELRGQKYCCLSFLSPEKVLDDKDSTANVFELELERNNDCKNKFTFIVNISNLKLLPGDYYVSISSKLISHWTNSHIPVNYYIALEKGSEFHV